MYADHYSHRSPRSEERASSYAKFNQLDLRHRTHRGHSASKSCDCGRARSCMEHCGRYATSVKGISKMKTIKSILLLLAGAAFGICTVLSCSDDSPRQSDAATCDCETPIAARIVSIDGDLRAIPAGEQRAAGITCMPGAQFISGSCTGANFYPTFDDVTLQTSGLHVPSGTWTCVFKNNTAAPVQVRASVMCLKPSA
jgi:hypothetical protein